MTFAVTRVDVDAIHPLRELHRHEMHCQIVSDSYPRRGFSDAYLLRAGAHVAGYGLVANRHYPNTVNEYYVIPAYRAAALSLFRQLLAVSGATHIRTQTNNPLLTLMLHDCAANITPEYVLFADGFTSHLPSPPGMFRKATPEDAGRAFEHKHEPLGDWLIETDDVIVATGGALTHYNPPYADLYMEVHEGYRRRGYGSYLIQELKRLCYESGKLPAARCGVANTASRQTLEKAGLLPCGHVLIGEVRKAGAPAG